MRTGTKVRHHAEANPAVDAVPSALQGEMRKMRERIERQHRANRTLGDLVRRLSGTKAVPAPIDVTPRLPVATIAQHPTRLPATDADLWWPAGPVAPSRPLVAPAGHDCLSFVDSIDDVVGVSVMGLHGVDLDRVVQSVADEQLKTKKFKPVFLTDSADFMPFASRGFAFEYFSSFRHYLAPKTEGGDDARQRVLERKWGLSKIVDRNDKRTVDRSYPPFQALAKHNAGMSKACHTDRFEWIIETLRIALSAERYDVAEGLSDYLLAFFDTLSKANVIAAARVLCRKFIAFGELERLRAFLFKNISHVKKDDSLFTWFSAYCSSSEQFSAEFALLPSGKINSYYISKRMSVAGEQVVPNLLAAADGSTITGNLLLANYFAVRQDASLYRMFVNRVIGKNGASLRRVSFGHDNLLGHLQFDKVKPAAKQRELVTVIMSAYNSADTIGYAVKSILAQSYGNLELLICDDGSTDGTLKVIEPFLTDPRVRLFRSKSQQGTYGIRNSLIAEARGSFVTFHDSDDYAFPDRIERQKNCLDEHGAAAVVGQWFRVDKGGEFVFSSDHGVARLAVVSLFAPKALFERFGPYRSARFGADTEFYERLRMDLGVEAVKLMPHPLMFGLASATSLTRSAGIEATEDGFRAPARRAYAAFAARGRHVGGGTSDIDDLLRNQGNLLEHAGAEPMGVSLQ
jgi:hypothetical protein